MLNPIDFKGFIAGWLLLLGALISIYWALYYYKKVPGPWKSLARRTLISLLLFGLGSVSAIIDSLTPRPLWFLMVIFYTLSYIAILSTIFLSLRAAATSIEKPGGVKERSTASKTPERNETREKELPLHSGYSIRKEPSPQLFYLLKKVSKGLIVVSRKSREEWIEKFGVHPDEFLWLSRADVENSIDPSKLHVIQGKVLQFMEQRGSVVVYFDGLEYLTLYNDFPSVAKFLFAVKDMVMIKNSLMLIHIPEGIFDKKQEIILLREFEEIEEDELIKKLSQVLPPDKTDELALFGVISPTTKEREAEDAGDKSPEEGSRVNKEEAQKAQTLRREETTEEGK
ncbi:DUF835 domain-containing protein [Thermococcus peptonophilus]|uniref:DUF835 domain-containing protein n=1 Tax=Thermococcus peptonophilus TaxID=53952 RepID=A0A142CUI5_9EURY|nr:DUF835 domain-containing protein [Thermococcus peptonophilus]AMQ18437.1 hypothetical protein A0127_04250 [Thermococcus peptonophilus]